VTPFEKLLAIASGESEVLELARDMIGKKELALLLAKAALHDTSQSLSPTRVANAMGIAARSASDRIQNCASRPDTAALGMTVEGARKKIQNCAVKTGGAS
jgi:hypothetical protein